ncbi:MAG TPA: hypothetical protein VLB04_00540 [Methanotrichaceae archaeon]|nr:hypothetical protein [Methanotrichaceae archaeon]
MALRYNERLIANRVLQIILGVQAPVIFCAFFVSFVIFVVDFVLSRHIQAI